MKQLILPLLLSGMVCTAQASEVKKLQLKPAPGMTRADLYMIETVPRPQSVFVLSPGCNGSGEGLLRRAEWQEFAKKHKLGLVGLSFASSMEDIHNGKGYYYARNGSGELLLQGIKTLYRRDLPVLLYGFSGGAHFTSRFAEWKPARVISWCAYSAGWWDEPKPSGATPPGIVACGNRDERLGASLMYFKQGRAIGKPWLWVGVPNNGHSPDARAEMFIRDYFAAVLSGKTGMPRGVWIDVDKKQTANPDIVRDYPSVTAWLPNAKLFDRWQSIHEP